MPFPEPHFYPAKDRFNTSYFAANLSNLQTESLAAWRTSINASYFTARFMTVTLLATNRFSSDLTPRDDILLAFMSMLLLITIEGILATILLSTKDGQMSSVGLSVKCILEVLRHFDWTFSQLRSGHRERGGRARRGRSLPTISLNRRLVILSVCMLGFILGLESVILLFTAPTLTPISNKLVSLRIQTSLVPNWGSVRLNLRTSIDVPCQSLLLWGVEHGRTRITACVLANVTGIDSRTFDGIVTNGELKITTLVHMYGAEHFVSIGDWYGEYSTRGFLTLGDGRERLIRQREGVENEDLMMEGIHLTFVGYLYSIYNRVTEDEPLTLEKLNAINFTHQKRNGPDWKVLDVDGRDETFPTTKYSSTIDGVLPNGSMTLHFAHQVFRTSAAMRVVEGNETDLFEDKGFQTVNAIVWLETTRVLNWLSLLLLLLCALLILAGIRWKLKPVATANIASEFVKRAVGAEIERSPVEIDERENRFFRVGERQQRRGPALGTVPVDTGREYAYGSAAGRDDSWAWAEYSDHED